MNRFFVEGDCRQQNYILSQQEVHHMRMVMRMQIGDRFEIFDALEQEYIARITDFGEDRVYYELEQAVDSRRELRTRVFIYQGIPKSQKMEWIIQKCTELGAHSFIPVHFRRCVSDIHGKEAKKIARWQKISGEASKQSKRRLIPQVGSVCHLDTLATQLARHDMNIILYELENKHSLQECLAKISWDTIQEIGIVIGPEGGLEAREVEALLQVENTYCATLGERILRTETVGVYMMSVLSYLMEQ